MDDKHAGGAGARATCALALTAVGRGGSNFGGRWEEGHATRVVCERRAGAATPSLFHREAGDPGARVESWTSAGHSPAPRRQARGEGCRHIRLHHRCFMTELQPGVVRGGERKKVCLNENAVAGARGEGSQLMQARTCCYENSQNSSQLARGRRSAPRGREDAGSPAEGGGRLASRGRVETSLRRSRPAHDGSERPCARGGVTGMGIGAGT